MKVHSGPGPYEFEGEEYDAEELYNVMIEKYTGISPLPGSFAVASWFHLLMGYDAGYYGYIYSEAIAGKSALVLFIMRIRVDCPYLIPFANHMY